MEIILHIYELFIHLDKHLGTLIHSYGSWIYLLVFMVIFCETGLVITPLLPGDSLLFALGTFAALGTLEVELLVFILTAAAILGDTVNYTIGKWAGIRLFYRKGRLLFKKEYLIKTQHFYECHGGKTIFLARFIPIIRTFAPFVAGIGTMAYPKFLIYNVTGAITWVLLFVMSGYFFGNIPQVKQNFSFVIMGIIFVSCFPILIEYWRNRSRHPKEV